jgi:tripartite-type tricarboxylate transporter receptor subunit TctC
MTSRFWLGLSLTVALGTATILVSCSTPAAAPAPTTPPKQEAAAAPASPQPAATKPAEAPKPTDVPKKVDYPQKGKTITFIVPNPAGGASDLAARLLAPLLEKELGVSVQVVNKAGAASQVGMTELAQSKPDGYTIALTNLPGTINTYLDPERKAAFSRKDIQPVALHHVDPAAVAVRTESPYKTLKELVDAAKANPKGLKASTDGLQGEDHLTTLQFGKIAGVEFTPVHFEGGAPANVALLGGHTDVRFGKVSTFIAPAKAGQLRVLAVMDKDPSKFYPDVKTAEAQGFKLYMYSTRGVTAPGGTPKEIVEALSSTIKKVMATDEHKKKIDELGLTERYQTSQEFYDNWTSIEEMVRPLLEMAKQN